MFYFKPYNPPRYATKEELPDRYEEIHGRNAKNYSSLCIHCGERNGKHANKPGCNMNKLKFLKYSAHDILLIPDIERDTGIYEHIVYKSRVVQ